MWARPISERLFTVTTELFTIVLKILEQSDKKKKAYKLKKAELKFPVHT